MGRSMIRIVSFTLACSAALVSATLISWATSPNDSEAAIRAAHNSPSAAPSSSRSEKPVRVVYAGYGLNINAARAPEKDQAAHDAGTSIVEAPPATSTAPSLGGFKMLSPANALVDVNTASLDDLNATGGGLIGKAIVKGRPYQKLDDLVTKRVISRATFENIKNRVAVNS